jgi:hypothetical protein
MIKSNAIVKVDSEENWKKALNYIPDTFTIIVYTYENDSPRVKIGDGFHKVNDLPFLVSREVIDKTLIL